MVAGDLVNTASRLQSVARSRGRCSSARRRSGRRRARSSSSRPATRSSRARQRRCRPGARCGSSPSAAASGRSEQLEPPFVGRDERAAADQGLLPRAPRASAAAARLDHRPGRHRQEPARMGVPEVHRRRRPRSCYWHQGRSPGVRRGHHASGRSARWSACGSGCGDGRRGDDPRASSRRASRSTCPTRTSARWIEPRLLPAARARRCDDRRTASSCSRRGGPSSSASRTTGARGRWSSRTSNGPTRGCSTSSRTC